MWISVYSVVLKAPIAVSNFVLPFLSWVFCIFCIGDPFFAERGLFWFFDFCLVGRKIGEKWSGEEKAEASNFFDARKARGHRKGS